MQKGLIHAVISKGTFISSQPPLGQAGVEATEILPDARQQEPGAGRNIGYSNASFLLLPGGYIELIKWVEKSNLNFGNIDVLEEQEKTKAELLEKDYKLVGQDILGYENFEGKEKIKVFITTSNGRCLKGVGKENLSIYKVQTDVLGNKRFIKKEGDAPKLEFENNL